VQVLQELVGDKALQRFRVEYEKLFRTLKKSHGVHTTLCSKPPLGKDSWACNCQVVRRESSLSCANKSTALARL
jgi:hypothetical protein